MRLQAEKQIPLLKRFKNSWVTMELTQRSLRNRLYTNKKRAMVLANSLNSEVDEDEDETVEGVIPPIGTSDTETSIFDDDANADQRLHSDIDGYESAEGLLGG